MKIGIIVPNYARWWRGDAIWATCEKAKEIGLDSLHFVDHVIFTPAQYVGYGNGYMDMYTTMSYVAAITNIQKWPVNPSVKRSEVDRAMAIIIPFVFSGLVSFDALGWSPRDMLNSPRISEHVNVKPGPRPLLVVDAVSGIKQDPSPHWPTN